MPELTNLRPHVERVWQRLRAPLRLGSGVCLALQPSSVRVTPPRERPARQRHVGVTVQPLLSVGSAPEVPPLPLPPLHVAPVDGGPVQLALDARISFAELGQRLKAELRGRELRLEHGRLRVDDVAVEGSAGGAPLRVHVTLRTGSSGCGGWRGTCTSPPGPATTRRAGCWCSRSWSTAWARSTRWRSWPSASGTWPCASSCSPRPLPVRAAGVAAPAGRAGLRRELAPGLRLDGDVEGFTPVGVYADGTDFVVRGQARGRLTLHAWTRGAAGPARQALRVGVGFRRGVGPV